MVEQETVEKEEPKVEINDEYFRKYILTGKGKNPKEKIDEACKEINYQKLVVLIAVGDYVINKAKNIKEIVKKWGLCMVPILHLNMDIFLLGLLVVALVAVVAV